MNPPSRISSIARPPRRGLFALLLLSGLTGTATSAAPAPAVSAPKTHTLFMGADISVERDKNTFRVKDVDGGDFIIERQGQRESVPMNRGAVNMRVDLSLKLTERSADIQDLKAERTYTPENDPRRKFQQPGGAGDAQATLALGRVNAVQTDAAAAGVAYAASAGGPGAPFAAAAREQAIANVGAQTVSYNNALVAAQSDFNSSGYYAGRLQEELAKQEFDAIDLSFAVSSPRPLAKPYVVVTAAYRAKGDRPGVQRNWVYAQALPPIGAASQPVRVRQGGFPIGYELQGCQVHLYDGGTEVATNVAPKRVMLTRDEAVQYVVMDYVSTHKAATVPARPVMGDLPADLPARLAQGQFAAPIFVKVTKDGVPAGAFRDEACARPVDDAYLNDLVTQLRFTPALTGGKPVDGVARVQLSELHLTI